jgi:hypothetical protein
MEITWGEAALHRTDHLDFSSHEIFSSRTIRSGIGGWE